MDINNKERSTHATWLRCGLSVTLCLALNGAVFAVIAANHPEVLYDSRLEQNPDAKQYLALGHNFWLHGAYSRCPAPPLQPDLLRTPIFPLLAGGLDLLAGSWAVFACNVLSHVGICICVYVLACRLFGNSAALLASLFVATDLMLAINNFQAMSESLFTFLLLASLALLVPAIIRSEKVPTGILTFALGGLLLGLATLTRPTSLYLPVILGLLMLVRVFTSRQFRSWALCGAAMAATCALPVAPWIIRNYIVFDVPRLTNIDRTNLVYFVGAGAYQVRHGLTLDEAQQRISSEYSLPDYSVLQNPWTTDASPTEMDRQLAAVVPDVLMKYPKELTAASALAVAKASVSHNTGLLALLCGWQWNAPGAGSLAKAQPAAFGRLFSNNPVLVVTFGWQLLHTAAALFCAVVGIFVGLRSSATRFSTIAVLALLSYLYLTVAVFGFEAFWRCRIPVVPLLFVVSGAGLASCLHLLASWKTKLLATSQQSLSAG